MKELFTFGELWGPFNCEWPDCDCQTFCCVLSKEESDRVKAEEHRPNFILNEKLGTMLCKEHLKEAIDMGEPVRCNSLSSIMIAEGSLTDV